jgi:CheY-like chemotaxis protein
VRETLAGRGLRFVEAVDGGAALAEIARARPDAIVLDLVMPNMDGFDVLERLDADPALRMIPVIVLTGHLLTAAEQMQLRARTVSLLEKSSYSGTELRALIERALAQQPLDGLEEL